MRRRARALYDFEKTLEQLEETYAQLGNTQLRTRKELAQLSADKLDKRLGELVETAKQLESLLDLFVLYRNEIVARARHKRRETFVRARVSTVVDKLSRKICAVLIRLQK